MADLTVKAASRQRFARTAGYGTPASTGLVSKHKTPPVKSQLRGKNSGITSVVLARWRAICFAVSVVVAVVLPVSLNLVQNGDEAVLQASDQQIRVSKLQADITKLQNDLLVGANQESTDGLAATVEADLQTVTDSATEIIVNADGTQALPVDVNRAVMRYAAQVTQMLEQMSAAGTDTAQMSEQIDQLDADLSQLLANLVTDNYQTWTNSVTRANWAMLLAFLPALVIAVGSVRVAVRTKRVINPGLAAGLLIALGAAGLTVNADGLASTNYEGHWDRQLAMNTAEAAYLLRESERVDLRLLSGLTSSYEAESNFEDLKDIVDGYLTLSEGDLVTYELLVDQHAVFIDTFNSGDGSAWALYDDMATSYEQLCGDAVIDSQAALSSAVVEKDSRAQQLAIRRYVISGLYIVSGIACAAGISRVLRRYL